MRTFCWLGLFTVLFFVTSCGSGGGDKVGSLSLTLTSTAGSGVYNVAADATYTHPTKTDLTGTEITFDTIPAVPGFPVTTSTNYYGKAGYNIPITQGATAINLYVTARVGDLVDSKFVTIPALGAFALGSNALTFTSTEVVPTQKTVSISGGTSPYSASSSNALVTASVSGTTLTITRASNATGTSVVTVNDSASSSNSGTVTVTLQ